MRRLPGACCSVYNERPDMSKAVISVPVTVWTGINPWFVSGDGVAEPVSVCTTDASGTEVGFLPFGYALPGMLLRQAEGLRDMLNQARAQHDAV